MTHPQTSSEWDARYSEKDQLWSGNPNKLLIEMAANLPAGTALDVGCGEGADSIWLAQRGWQVTGIDLSTVAIQRARASAAVHNLSVDFQVADVVEFAQKVGPKFDLVSVFFLHSRDDQARAAALAATAKLVAPGGRILVVSHAEMPPWSQHHHHEDGSPRPTFDITAASEISELKIGAWTHEVAEERGRTVVSPEGEEVTLRDAVVLARKPA